MQLDKVYQGDALEVLKTFDDKIADRRTDNVQISLEGALK